MKATIRLLGALGSLLSGSTQAAIVAAWDFDSVVPTLNDSALGPVVAATAGTGSFQGVHASSDSDWVAYVGNGSNGSYGSESNWTVGDYY